MSPLLKLPMNVGNLGKLIVAKALKSCPKSNKLSNLVTLHVTQFALLLGRIVFIKEFLFK